MIMDLFQINLKLILVTLMAIIGSMIFHNYNYSNKILSNNVIYNKRELETYNGKENKLYLAIIGTIYDVSSGNRHYGIGNSYHYFVGKDGTRAFVTGNFKDESNTKDHVLDLSCDNLLSLLHWRRTFKNKYKYVGLLSGRYYDDNGKETEYMLTFKQRINECLKEKERKKNHEKLYPPCNIAWSEDEGTKVWCTKSSGGIVRNWVGVPRQLYSPGADKPKCVCVSEDKLNNSLLKEYSNCHKTSAQCVVE